MKRPIQPDQVAIYIRWSTEDQGLGHTLAIQQESCRYYCLSQGWAPRPELTFIDDGCSGATLERPALTRLRQAVQAGQVSCVVVYKLDRLSRNVKDLLNLVLGEWEESCSVRSTQEPVDTTSDAGRLFFTMLGSFADFERATIKTRTWSGKRKNAEQGKNPGMVYPYGFAKGEGATWVIEEAEAAVVRHVYREYLKGRSCRAIAFALNDQGVRTRSGRPWATADISRLIRNPLYAGRLVYNRRSSGKRGRVENPADQVITREGAAPAIIEPDLWEKAQRTRTERPRIHGARVHASPYLLAGLLRCPCGQAWVGVQGGQKNERFYACAGARSGGPARCDSRLIRAATLHEAILAQVRQQWQVLPAFDPGWLAPDTDALSPQRAMQQRLATLTAALERFRRDYAAGRLPGELYAGLYSETCRERDQLAARLRAGSPQTPPAPDLQEAARRYEAMDPWAVLAVPEQQQVLRLVIERIIMQRPRGARDVALDMTWRLPGIG